MAIKGSIIRYTGVRGITWRIKYRDPTGRQIMETVGREKDGITRKHAKQRLRERLGEVESLNGRHAEVNIDALLLRIRSIQDEIQAINTDLHHIKQLLHQTRKQ